MNAHIIVSVGEQLMRMFVYGEAQSRHVISCSNETIGSNTADPYGPYGPCPLGDYYLGVPAQRTEADGYYYLAEGRWFTPLIDVNNLFVTHNRSEIGVHGGGSAAPDPLAPRQGWYPTEGCFRLQNEDNENVFVPFVQYIQAHSNNAARAVLFTVRA